MKNMRVAGVLGIGAIVLIMWYSMVFPEITNTHEVFESTAENIGFIQLADEVGGELSEPIKMVSVWSNDVIEDNGNRLLIHTIYDFKDILTGESLWVTEFDEYVDQTTRRFLDKPGYHMFPSNLQQQDYQVYDIGGAVMNFEFIGVLEIDGLEVYEFTGKTTFDISDDYPDFEEQIFEDYSSTSLIEPVTGIEVSFTEQFTDYAIIDGQKVVILDAWDEPSQFSQKTHIQKVNSMKTLHKFYYDVIPIGIIVITASIAAIFLFQSKFKKSIIHVGLLEKINATLERVSMVGELTSRLVHDLKNPLSVISMNSQLMKMETTDEKVMNRIKQIDESYDSIMMQIQDTLDYVKHGKLTFRDTLLSGIISKAIRIAEIPDEIKVNQELKEITISADNLIMQVVFSNLLKNSVNAIDGKGEINIRVEEMKDKVKIEFEDSGPSIPQKDLEKIFDSVDITEFTGNNIGLVSCKKIIEKHNGKIKIKNNPTTFTVILPKIITGQ